MDVRSPTCKVLSENGGLIVQMPESDQGHPPVITGGVCLRQLVFVAKSGWGNGDVKTAMRCANEALAGMMSSGIARREAD